VEGVRASELTEPVALCDPTRRGQLNRAAVGWSRVPLHDCNLQGRPFAKKRWNYWAFITESHFFSATIANLDYAGFVSVCFADFERGQVEERSEVTPFGRGCVMPRRVHESLAFRGRKLQLEFERTPDSVEVRVGAEGFAGGRLEAELEALYPVAHETLNVVIPWSERTFQFTAKHNALPAHGELRVGGRRVEFGGAQSFATLDFGRGVWPRRSAWNWAAAAGVQDGRIVGLNLGGQWTRGSGMTENALSVAGRVEKIDEELDWSYDPADLHRPWRIHAPTSGVVDLRFTPFLERASKLNAALVRARTHQLFGYFDGTLKSRDGRSIEVRELVGWAEDHRARW